MKKSVEGAEPMKKKFHAGIDKSMHMLETMA